MGPIELAVVLVFLVVLGAILGIGVVQVLSRPDVPAPVILPPVVADLPAAAPARPAPQLPGKITVQLHDPNGRVLGTVEMDPRMRRPTYQHRFRNGRICTFVADRREPNGVWVYRRVGIERSA